MCKTVIGNNFQYLLTFEIGLSVQVFKGHKLKQDG